MYANNLLRLLNDVTFEILSALSKSDGPLSLYDFNQNYSLHQYRYWCKKLESELILTPIKSGKRKHYLLNKYYKEKVDRILSIGDETVFRSSLNLSPGLKDKQFLQLCSLLKQEEGWAFADSTALLLWVPILDLELARFTVFVRDRNLYRRLSSYFPSSLLKVELKPSFFIKTAGTKILNGLPVLKPELLFFRLLRKPNERLRLSALFLLPYLNHRLLFSKLNKNYRDLLPTVVYGLFVLQNFLDKTSGLGYLDFWFYNLSQYDWQLIFTDFVFYYGRKGMRNFVRTFLSKFELTRIKLQQETDQWDFWDQCSLLFPQRNFTFTPESFKSLVSTNVAT